MPSAAPAADTNVLDGKADTDGIDTVSSDGILLAVGFCGLLIVFALIMFLVTPSKEAVAAAKEKAKPRQTRAQRKAELKDKLRRRRAAQRRAAGTDSAAGVAISHIDMDDDALAAVDEGEISASDNEIDLSSLKGSKKKLRKLQKKQEKKDRREWEAHQREVKEERREEKKATSKYAQKLAAREEQRLAQEAEEAEAKRLEEEAAQKEFDSWKDMFEVDEVGDGDDAIAEESQGLLQDFIDYVKQRKVVVLEDVAGEFGIRSQEVVNRLNALMSMGRLTGVLDDRGKFIYITEEEMGRVADFIKREGRVSLAALAERSNELIDLNPLQVVVPDAEENQEDQEDQEEEEEGNFDAGRGDKGEMEGDIETFEIEGVSAGRDKGKKIRKR